MLAGITYSKYMLIQTSEDVGAIAECTNVLILLVSHPSVSGLRSNIVSTKPDDVNLLFDWHENNVIGCW